MSPDRLVPDADFRAIESPARVLIPVSKLSLATLAECAAAKLRMAGGMGTILVTEIDGIAIKLSRNGFFADDGMRGTAFKKTVEEAVRDGSEMTPVSEATKAELIAYYDRPGYKGD